MKIVVIASQKGGSGKTTLAAHLAVAAEQAGKGPVVLIDKDPQQTLSTWWNQRQAEAPKLATVALRDLPTQVDALASNGFQYCTIDTPPALTEQNRQVLKLADLVLIPARPSANDLWALGATLHLVQQSEAAFVFVLTQAKPKKPPDRAGIAALSEHGQVLQSIIHDRVSYADCMTDGRTALEINPSCPAAIETVELWKNALKSELAKLSELAKREGA